MIRVHGYLCCLVHGSSRLAFYIAFSLKMLHAMSYIHLSSRLCFLVLSACRHKVTEASAAVKPEEVAVVSEFESYSAARLVNSVKPGWRFVLRGHVAPHTRVIALSVRKAIALCRAVREEWKLRTLAQDSCRVRRICTSIGLCLESAFS